MEVSPEDTSSIYQVLLQHVECFLLLHSYDFLVNFRVSRNPVFRELLNLFNIDPSTGGGKKQTKQNNLLQYTLPSAGGRQIPPPTSYIKSNYRKHTSRVLQGVSSL